MSNPLKRPTPFIRRAVALGAVVLTVTLGICHMPNSAAPAIPAKGTLLIQKVNAAHLFALLGATQVGEAAFAGQAGSYRGVFRGTGARFGFSITVFPTIADARRNFQQMGMTSLAPTRLPDGTIGDECLSWRGEPGTRGNYGTGRLGYAGWPSQCVLRRRNVQLSFSYSGPTKDALVLARKIDRELINSDALAPKGATVPIPQIAFNAPKIVPLGGRNARIKIYSVRGERLLGVTGKDKDEWSTQGWMYLQANRLGEHKLERSMMSEGNVVFTRSITVQVVSPREYEAARTVHPWKWSHDALYFLTNPRVNGHVKVYYDKGDEGEWLKPDPGTIGHYYYGDEDKQEQLMRQALQEWGQALKAEWLPAPDMLTVGFENTRAHPSDYVAYCTFTRKEAKALIMGKLGKSFLVYVEQPDSLPAGVVPLTAADLIRPEFKADSRGSFKSSSLFRYRAFRPQGPYQRVRVLLLRFNSGEAADLTFPGYEGAGYR